ncbi:MAG: hypothetical protein AB203_04435 [Parcubacteria bacterium C7867-008]|nr:MAG: hypothetical protein AB203_04435 [Parcubacteria bacterium C7867-008]
MDNQDRVTYFAATDSRGKRVPFGLKAKDRNRHMYVIGKTGMGKSTLLENMAIQDIRNGEGMAFIDPHGSAVEKLLEYIPEHRMKDVVYFAPFDMEQPIAFNIMEDVGYDKRHLVVSGLMATFKKIWQDAWSARMEYILTNTLLALLEYPGATLLGVNRMYTDKAYRKKVIDNIKDPVVKDFWTKEFANYGDRYTQEATPAIQNKIGQFTSNPLIRNIIGQEKSSFDIRELMDSKKILLINLSKGLVGDTNMRLLGSMLTTRIFLGAMSRAELDPEALKNSVPFYFYVDEFQNFANETFAEILSEARKYNLNLVIAHQYVEQMEEQVRAAVFGNVGTTVAFRVGPFDAEVLETVFSPEFMKEDLVNLGQFQLYLSLMINGVGSRPFSAVSIPSIEPPPVSLKKEVIAASRAQFGNHRAAIEEAIFAELASTEGENGPPEPPAKRSYAKPAGGQNAYPPRPSNDRPREDRPRTDDRPRPSSDRPTRSQDDRPRRDDNHSSDSRPPRQDRPQQQMPAPKSTEDLKAILRGMAETASNERTKAKPEQPSGSLKGALADVLKKEQAEPTPMPKPRPKPPMPERDSDEPVEKRKPIAEVASQSPYEVPEQTLRDLFKDR